MFIGRVDAVVPSYPWGHGDALPVGSGLELPGLGVTCASLSTAPQAPFLCQHRDHLQGCPALVLFPPLQSWQAPVELGSADPRQRAGVPVGGVPRTLQSRDPCPACFLQPCTALTLSRWPALPGAEGGCLGSPCGQSFCSVAPGRLQRGKPCHLGCGGPCGVLGQTPG